MHIGSCNWIIEIAQKRIGIMTNASLDSSYRHPKELNINAFKQLDLMVVGSVCQELQRQSFEK